MTKNIRTLYLYIVAFITIGMIASGVIYAAHSLTSYFLPQVYAYNYYPAYDMMESTEPTEPATEDNEISPMMYNPDADKPANSGDVNLLNVTADDIQPISEPVIKKVDYAKALQNYKDNLAKEELRVKKDNLKEALTAIAIVLIAAPLFVYHWKRIEKERKEVGV